MKTVTREGKTWSRDPECDMPDDIECQCERPLANSVPTFPKPVPALYFVVAERGGLLGVWVDNEDKARKHAKATEAVVASLPIIADYRKPVL